MKHYKEIEITESGMIIASVYCEDGRRTALEFFNRGLLDHFRNRQTAEHIEKRCIEAHEWADKTIAVHDKYETCIYTQIKGD